MLAAAQAAAGHGRGDGEYRAGQLARPGPRHGPFALVAMGRSFHWMDRAATLAMRPHRDTGWRGGAVPRTHPPVEENGWFKILRDVQDKFGRAAAPHVMEKPKNETKGGHRRYEPFLVCLRLHATGRIS